MLCDAIVAEEIRVGTGSDQVELSQETAVSRDWWRGSCGLLAQRGSFLAFKFGLERAAPSDHDADLPLTELQFGRLSFFNKVVYRGSWCKLFRRGSTFVPISPPSRWA
jgi:hypothetical protein